MQFCNALESDARNVSVRSRFYQTRPISRWNATAHPEPVDGLALHAEVFNYVKLTRSLTGPAKRRWPPDQEQVAGKVNDKWLHGAFIVGCRTKLLSRIERRCNSRI